MKNLHEEQLPSSDEDFGKSSNSKKQKTASAICLVTTAKLSTRKAHKVCKTLSESGVSIPTPSQSGVYRAVMRKGEELKKHFVENLRHENWCLHFDGKTIQKEYQVVVLKNENKEIRLAVVELVNEKGKTIFDGIKSILDEYKLWSSIKMIVSDTTAGLRQILEKVLVQSHCCRITLNILDKKNLYSLDANTIFWTRY